MGNHKRLTYRLGGLIAIAICIVVIVVVCISPKDGKTLEAPKTITVWTSSDIVADPLLAKNSQQFYVASLTSATLLDLDGNEGVKNGLAKGFKLSDDALTLTVDLSGAKFSNGDAITSSDVKASLSRLAKSGVFPDLVKNVKGYGEAKSGSDFFGIDTKKKDSVVFTLITPDPYFVFSLAHPATGILSTNSIIADGTIDPSVSSGDYVAKKIDVTTTYTPRNKELPTVKVVKKTDAELAANKTSDPEIVLASGQNETYKEVSVPQLATASWNIYVKDGSSPLADVRLRKAILLALDEKESIAPYESRAVSPKRFGVDVFDSVECSTNCKSDKSEAKKLLEALYPDGNIPTLDINIENNDIQKKLALSASSELKAVGITTNIKEQSAQDLSNSIARGEVQLFRFGWVSDVAVMANGLVEGYKADSPDNVDGIADATFEEDVEKFLQANTLEERKETSQAMQERLKDLWLVRPIALFQNVISVNETITGVKVDFYGRIDMVNVRKSEPQNS